MIDNKKEVVKDEKLEIDEEESQENTNEERPTVGISTYIGKSVEELQSVYGQPSRQEPSYYGYTWWVYNQNNQYMLVGVLDNTVVTVTVASSDIDISPFKIGENLEDLYTKITMQPEVELENENGVYRFELFEDDLNIKPLIPLGDIYAQLYFDHFEGKLVFVRFMDADTLIKQRPYDIAYRGELIESEPLTDEQWAAADAASQQQIFELTNIIRSNYSLSQLTWDDETSQVAYNHSVDMFETETFSHESEKYGDLANRLKSQNIYYESAGENIAYQYTDSIDVMSGWLNSKGHRETLLNEEFTHLGVGVYKKYYTQNFLQKSWEQ